MLKYLTDYFYDIKKTASRLKITERAVYKHIGKLRNFSLIIGSSKGGFTKPNLSHMGGFTKQPTFRLHDAEIRLTLRGTSKHNKKTCFYRGTRYHIYKTSIRIWQKNRHFYGNTIKKCYDQAELFWNDMFRMIKEKHNLHIIDIEESHVGEIEEISSEMAKKVNKEAKQGKTKRWQFHSTEDNKVWFETDKSLKRDNSETKHSDTSREDGELIFEDIYNGYRDKTAYTPRQCTHMINALFEDRKFHAENQRSHVEMVREVRDYFKNDKDEMRKEQLENQKEMNKLLKNLNDKFTDKLELVKEKISSLDDLKSMHNEIMALCENDRLKLSDWLIERFDLECKNSKK